MVQFFTKVLNNPITGPDPLHQNHSSPPLIFINFTPWIFGSSSAGIKTLPEINTARVTDKQFRIG